MHPYFMFSLWRQMAPRRSAKFRTVCFRQMCTSLRKDSVTNSGSICTQFLPYVGGLDIFYKATKRLIVPSIGGATRFANLR